MPKESTLRALKAALTVGTTVRVTNHYITNPDHPLYGTRTVTVLRANSASYEFGDGHGGSGGVIRWPTAKNVALDGPNRFLIFGHPKPGDLLFTVEILP